MAPSTRGVISGALALATCAVVALLSSEQQLSLELVREGVAPKLDGIETHALKKGEKAAAAAAQGVAPAPGKPPAAALAPTKAAPVEEALPATDAPADFPAMAKRFSKGVVQIMVVKAKHQWMSPQNPPATEEVSGSGFFIENKHLGEQMAASKDLHIVTNAHVAMDAVQLTIRLPKLGLAPVKVSVVGLSPPEEHDIALLRVAKDGMATLQKLFGGALEKDLIRLPIGDSDPIKAGEKLMALGYPEGMPGVKSTLGVMSGYQEMERKLYMQMTTPINPGNSGGPLLSEQGEVIGVNTAGIEGSENIGFSIPAAVLKAVLPVLIEHRVFVRPLFGIVLNPTIDHEGELFNMPADTKMEGEYISKVYEGTVAHHAGMRPGDVLVSVDGMAITHRGQMMFHPIDTFLSLDGYLGRTTLGATLQCIIWRDGKQIPLALPYEITPDLAIPTVYEAAIGNKTPEHQIAGGLVFAALTQNFVKQMITPVVLSSSQAQVPAPQLIKYSRYPDDRKEPKVVVADVVSSSLAENTKAFDSAMIVDKVNHRKVRTMADLCLALAHPVQDQRGQAWLTVEGEDGELGTMRMSDIADNDAKLEHLGLYKRTHCDAAAQGASPSPPAAAPSAPAPAPVFGKQQTFPPDAPKPKGHFWALNGKKAEAEKGDAPPGTEKAVKENPLRGSLLDDPKKAAGKGAEKAEAKAEMLDLMEMGRMGDGEAHMERMQAAMDRGYTFAQAHRIAKLPSIPSMAELMP